TGKWLEQFAGGLTRLQQEAAGKSRFVGMLEEAAKLSLALRGSLDEKYPLVKQFADKAESASSDGATLQYVFSQGVVDIELREVIDSLAVDFVELASRISKITDLLKESLETEGMDVEREQA